MNSDLIMKYGVVLRRLHPTDLELVRYWRNHPVISQYMVYCENITREMQLSWFKTINNNKNFYFIVEWETRSVGLINIRDVDEVEKCGEAGVFFWDEACLNSDIPPRASLAIYDFAYEQLGLFFISAKIAQSNRRAIRYNKQMGFKLQQGHETSEVQKYRQTREDYFLWRKQVSCLFD